MINQTPPPQIAQAASPDLSAGPISHVDSAANQCHQEGTGNGNTVPMPVEPKPTSYGRKAKAPALTFTSGERQRHCEQCGAKMTVKRPNNFKPKRFCNNQCKRRYHYLKFGK